MKMSREDNAALVRRYFEECVVGVGGSDREHALSVADEILAADFVMLYNNETLSDTSRGREAHKAFLIEHAQAYPKDHWTIETLVADDDVVACRWRITATHAGSGKPIDVRAADFFVVRDGRLAELRRFLDFADLRRQMRAPVPAGN